MAISLVLFSEADTSQEDIQRERRQSFEKSLDRIKTEVYDHRLPLIQEKYNVFRPTIFISYAWEDDIKSWIDQTLSPDLNRIGFDVLYYQGDTIPRSKVTALEEEIVYATYVVVLCTPQYVQSYLLTRYSPETSSGIDREMAKIMQRFESLSDRKNTVLPIYRKGDFLTSVPDDLQKTEGFDVSNEESYYRNFFALCQNFFLFEHDKDEPICEISKSLSKP